VLKMVRINKDKIHKILVIRTDKIGRIGSSGRYCGLGEALLSIPAIHALKQSFNVSVVALVNPVVTVADYYLDLLKFHHIVR